MANHEQMIFGEDFERCPQTGRPYERGSGALSKAEQTANFLHEAAIAADMPKDGERCVQTGREFECGSQCWTKSRQTAKFLDELSPAEKAQRKANAAALAAIVVAGQA